MEVFSPEAVSVFSFSGVYQEETFWRRLSDSLRFFDLTGLTGTNGYLSDDAQKEIVMAIDTLSPARGLHFIDSGNTHYMTKLFTDRIRTPFGLILFDHHPDMLPPAFGGLLSCGSWLRDALEHNSFMERAWLVGVDEALARKAQIGDVGKPVDLLPADALPPACDLPFYLSVDKDVLAESELRTNWDQGNMHAATLFSALRLLRDHTRLLGVDICGECDRPINLTQRAALRKNDDFNANVLDIFVNAR